MVDSTSFEVGDIVGLAPDYFYVGEIVRTGQIGRTTLYYVQWPFFNGVLSYCAASLFLMHKGNISNVPEEW